MPPTPRPDIPDVIIESRAIAVGRHIRAEAAPGIGSALVSGGVRAMEITLNEPEPEALPEGIAEEAQESSGSSADAPA